MAAGLVSGDGQAGQCLSGEVILLFLPDCWKKNRRTAGTRGRKQESVSRDVARFKLVM